MSQGCVSEDSELHVFICDKWQNEGVKVIVMDGIVCLTKTVSKSKIRQSAVVVI